MELYFESIRHEHTHPKTTVVFYVPSFFDLGLSEAVKGAPLTRLGLDQG